MICKSITNGSRLLMVCWISSQFDMVNVHLFHDASNLLAAERSPSVYSQFRKNALEHTLQTWVHRTVFICHGWKCAHRLPLNVTDTPVPYAIFGDFNFRLDAHRLLDVRLLKKRVVLWSAGAPLFSLFDSILRRSAMVWSIESGNLIVMKFWRLWLKTLKTKQSWLWKRKNSISMMITIPSSLTTLKRSIFRSSWALND